MKNICKKAQGFCLIVLAVSIVLAVFVPAMYYVAASAMLLAAVAAIAEPGEKAACPRVFSKTYKAEFHAA
jgi:competence protein ComGC